MLRNPLHIVALFQITKQIIACNNSLGASHWSEARLAQSAERKALNLVVVGSSPTVGVFWKPLFLFSELTAAIIMNMFFLDIFIGCAHPSFSENMRCLKQKRGGEGCAVSGSL